MVDVPADELTALLEEPLDRFVEARTARVKALRADGRRDEATALAKVRKPTKLVWAVGEVARRHPDAATEALEVAGELEAAQAAGDAVRPALRRFREVLSTLAPLADQVGGPDLAGEAGLALRAVLADPDRRQDWAGGRLATLPGDTPEAGARPDPASLPGSTQATRRQQAAARHEEAARQREDAERQRATEARARVVADLEAAGEQRRKAEAVVADVAKRLAALDEERGQLRRDLRAALRSAAAAGRHEAEVTSRRDAMTPDVES